MFAFIVWTIVGIINIFRFSHGDKISAFDFYQGIYQTPDACVEMMFALFTDIVLLYLLSSSSVFSESKATSLRAPFSNGERIPDSFNISVKNSVP